MPSYIVGSLTRQRVNLNVSEVKRAADDAARAISPDVRVAGVVLSASGSEYAEAVFDIEGCRKEPCRITVGVRRKPPLSALREQFAATLREHSRGTSRALSQAWETGPQPQCHAQARASRLRRAHSFS